MTWWPWARIRELERENASLRQTEELLRDTLDESQAWVRKHLERAEAAERQQETLIRAIVDLKRDGFNPPAPAPDIPVDDTPGVVLDALRDRLPPGSREYRAELELAKKRLADGEEPADVAKAVLKGNANFNPFG